MKYSIQYSADRSSVCPVEIFPSPHHHCLSWKIPGTVPQPTFSWPPTVEASFRRRTTYGWLEICGDFGGDFESSGVVNSEYPLWYKGLQPKAVCVLIPSIHYGCFQKTVGILGFYKKASTVYRNGGFCFISVAHCKCLSEEVRCLRGSAIRQPLIRSFSRKHKHKDVN